MADELNPQEEAPQGEAPQEGAAPEGQAPAEAAEAPAAPAEPPKGGSGLAGVALSFLFVGLAAAGILAYASGHETPWLLGAGLLDWGLMDFYSGRRGAKPASKLGSILNLFRAAFLTLLGAALLLSAKGWLPKIDSSLLLVAGAAFVTGTFLISGALELSTKSKDLLPHAMMQAALLLQFLSYLYFAVPGTVSWAAVLSLASFSCLAWASWNGGLKASPALGPGLGLVTILMGLPFFAFFLLEVMMGHTQPVVQNTLLMPRYYELKKGVSQQAANLAWAPGNTQESELGDIHYSDKLAWTDQGKDGKPLLSIYLHGEKQSGYAEIPMAEGSHRPWWSPDTRFLAATGESKGKGSLSLYHWEGSGPKRKGVRTTLEGENPLPHQAHGQIWNPDGSAIYYAGPRAGFSQGRTGIWRAATGSLSKRRLTQPASKYWPAAAPDGSKILYVSRKESVSYLEIGDGENGRNPRPFKLDDERALFPAWNKPQTQVLYLDSSQNLMITSANNRSDAGPFTTARLHSKVWKSEETDKVFTLEVKETGAFHKLWTMNPDGSRNATLYDPGHPEIIAPVWSPDSKRVALIEKDGAKTSVVTLARDGSWPRKCFITRDKVEALTWSPDSMRLAWFTRREGGGPELWMVERDSMSPELLYRGKGRLESLTWSPLGQHLAFEEISAWKLAGIRFMRPDIHKVLMLDIKEKAPRTMTVAGQNARQPSISPQGDMIAYVADQATFSWMPGIWSLSLSSKRPAAVSASQLF